MGNLATAFVSVMPDLRGFGQRVDADLSRVNPKGGEKVGRKISSGITSMVKLGIASLAGITAVDFLKDSIAEAREAATVTRLTAAAIKATGGAAHISAAQIADLAQSLSNKVGIDDEEIQSAENLLLSFKNVHNEAGRGNDIFNRSIQTALDLSQGMGISLPSATKVLGKALNDPLKGMTALQRVGVRLTDAQKAQITSMVKQGNTMGAQKVILDALKSRYGGLAAAAADPAQKAKVAWQNFQEWAGGYLLPLVNSLASWFAQKGIPMIESFGKAIAGMIGWMKSHEGVVKTLVVALGALYVAGGIQAAGGIAALARSLVVSARATTAGTVATRIFTAAQWLLNAAMTNNPIGWLIRILALLTAGVIVAYKTSATFRATVNSAWASIKAATSAMWGTLHAVLSSLHSWITRTVIPAVRSFWQTWAVPAFRAIATAASAAWRVISPILSGFNNFLRRYVGPTILWWWRNVTSPTLGYIWGAFRTFWSIARPILQLLRDIIVKTVGPAISWLWKNVVSPYFGAMGRGISSVWTHTIYPALRALKDYISKTLAPAFSTGVAAIGRAWGGLKAVAKGPVNFVIGTVYDKGIRGLFNKVASVVGSKARLPYIPMLARGGPVPMMPGASPDRDSVLAGLQPGEFVVRKDGSNIMDALQHYGMPGFIGGGWISGGLDWVKKKVGQIGSALKGGAGAVVSGVKGAAGGIGGWIQGMLGNISSGIIGNLKGLLGGVGGSPFAGLIKTAGTFLVSHLADFIKGKDKAVAGGAYNGPVPGGGSVSRWGPTVLRALALLGQSGAWLPTVLRRLNQESGGNPNAINNWDINAQNGVPSQGLMQVIPPTFAAYAGPYRSLGIRNPLANIYAGLNYALHRYGSLSALNRPGGYDSGGYLMPGQIGANYGRRPERVLSPQQTEAFDRLVEMLDGGGLGRPMEVHVTNNHPVAEPASVTVNRALQFTAALGR